MNTEEKFTRLDQHMALRFLIILVFSVFIVEFLIMLALHYLVDFDPFLEALVDSTLVIIVLFPLLYVLLFHPLREAIARQKKDAELLRKQNEFFNIVINSLSHPFYVIDVHDYSIKIANSAARSLGVGEHNTCYALTHKRKEPCMPPEHICPLLEVKMTRKPMVVEHIHFDKNGNPGNFEVHAFPIFDDRGNVIQMIEYSLDITERKRLEGEVKKYHNHLEELVEQRTAELKQTHLQLIQAEKMEAIGRMASGVAHEVKNPLGIVLQGINYLEDKIPKTQKDNFEALQLIKKNIKRADNIVRALVDFSRAGELKVRAEDINVIVEVSLDLIIHRITFENVKVVKELGKDLPKVLVDMGKMEQVFINLYLNALQAMPEGGTLSIRSYQTQLNEIKNLMGNRAEDYFSLGEKAVIVEVEDTGVGISKENLSKVFDAFFTTKGPKEGSGLGLPVVKSVIDMHKGLIEITSKEGKGTKIILTLKTAGEK